MPAEPPPTLLIAPDLRRRLQQLYEEALRLAALPRPDVRRVHNLLAECVHADPGNILYLDALLANLRRRGRGRAGEWWRRWLGWHGWWRRDRKASAGKAKRTEDQSTGFSSTEHFSTEYQALKRAPERLWNEGLNNHVLRRLAEAAAALDFDETELRFLQAARDAAPEDPITLKALAQTLTRQGRFEDAVGPWFAVLALTGDSEAALAVEDLRGSQETIDAENSLADEQATGGADLALLQRREDARLARSHFRTELARRRASHDDHPQAQQLVARLEAEHTHQEVEILNLRAERWPRDASVRLELSRRLKHLGNYSAAIQRLDEALQVAPQDAAVLVELGENWQHLRQFAKALDYYRQAIDAANNDLTTLNLARYRAAVLSVALGNVAAARRWLAAIVETDPAFRDARQRLDKLPPG